MISSSISKSVLISACLFIGTSQVFAQEIKSATFSAPEIGMGNPVDLSVVFQATSSTVWCGLLIEWGDGEKQNVRIGDDNLKTSPITLTHKYATAGTFNVSVKGNTMVRGLKTAQACGGIVKPATIKVVDIVAMQNAERQKQAAEREKAALEEAERAKKALEAKELEMKRKELEMKEEMLKREEELRKREDEARKKSQQRAPAPVAAPAPAPAPAPAQAPAQAPAPAGSKPAVKPASGF